MFLIDLLESLLIVEKISRIINSGSKVSVFAGHLTFGIIQGPTLKFWERFIFTHALHIFLIRHLIQLGIFSSAKNNTFCNWLMCD
jgi:hypothetical protein